LTIQVQSVYQQKERKGKKIQRKENETRGKSIKQQTYTEIEGASTEVKVERGEKGRLSEERKVKVEEDSSRKRG